MSDSNRPCYAHWCCNFIWTIPLGSIVALVGSLYGYFRWIAQGFPDVEDSMDKMGVDFSAIVGIVNSGVAIFLIANILVVLYGFREKCRTRLNILGHRTEGAAVLIKFIYKTVLHLIVIGSIAIVIAVFLYMEALYIMLLTMNAICSSSSSSDILEAVVDILDIFGGGSDNATKICDSTKEGRDGALKCFIGALVLIASQTMMFAYWMKYSTLANVPAYWTTGKYARSADDVEMNNASNI
jgi:hypothetical protein